MVHGRKEAGEKVDEKNIKKHKNDVFRLLTIVSPVKKVPIEKGTFPAAPVDKVRQQETSPLPQYL